MSATSMSQAALSIVQVCHKHPVGLQQDVLGLRRRRRRLPALPRPPRLELHRIPALVGDERPRKAVAAVEVGAPGEALNAHAVVEECTWPVGRGFARRPHPLRTIFGLPQTLKEIGVAHRSSTRVRRGERLR